MADELSGSDGFLAMTPTGAIVECSRERWAFIVEKHPPLAGLLEAIRLTIEAPDEIRRSRWAPDILLCYRRRDPRWLCAVIAPKSETLVTAYPTDAVKAGDLIWTPSA
jgi:hypothetical protein